MFHITNGDSASLYLKRIGIEGQFIAWQDVLHDGPLSDLTDLASSSEERAQFLADYYCIKLAHIRAKFNTRNDLLKSIEQSDEVILWLSPEMFDCLIGLQFVAWYRHHFEMTKQLKVVFFSDHIPPQELSADDMRNHYRTRFSPSDDFFKLANSVWQHLLLGNFAACQALDFSYWPTLQLAVKRYVEELPDNQGLTRTQWQILDCLTNSELSLAQLFGASQQLEEVPFMGDLSFWCQLEQIRDLVTIDCETSLLHQPIEFYHTHTLTLNCAGRKLL